MARMLGLTGTPGTGKKTVAPLIASRLGLPALSINDLLLPAGRRRDAVTIEVDSARARRVILRHSSGRCLVYGHLLADVLRRGDVERVVVLRCDPAVLKGRLIARGYSREKVRENVEAELIGLIATTASMKFGGARVSEVDTTPCNVPATAARSAWLLSGRSWVPPRLDWLEAYSSALKLTSLLSARPTRSPRT